MDIVAPASGVITEQNVTNAAGVQSLDNSPNLFTISDLSHVWIVCDVYENDLPTVRVGDTADIHLTAYPDTVLDGPHQQHRRRSSIPASGPPRSASKSPIPGSCASACS